MKLDSFNYLLADTLSRLAIRGIKCFVIAETAAAGAFGAIAVWTGETGVDAYFLQTRTECAPEVFGVRIKSLGAACVLLCHGTNVMKKAAIGSPYQSAVLLNYLVTLSSRFIIENIKMAASMQQIMNIPQSAYNSTLPHNKLPTKRNLFPMAVANNHPPCIKPWKRGGATFATKERPIGLRKSSAIVSMR